MAVWSVSFEAQLMSQDNKYYASIIKTLPTRY